MASNRTLVYKREPRGLYHITSKTVRGMYLFGKDPLTGKDYSHRREIVIERITYLARFFYIDLITFAVLINHVHLMLRNLISKSPAKRATLILSSAPFTSSLKSSGDWDSSWPTSRPAGPTIGSGKCVKTRNLWMKCEFGYPISPGSCVSSTRIWLADSMLKTD